MHVLPQTLHCLLHPLADNSSEACSSKGSMRNNSAWVENVTS